MSGCNRANPCLCGGCDARLRRLERSLNDLAAVAAAKQAVVDAAMIRWRRERALCFEWVSEDMQKWDAACAALAALEGE